MYLSSLYGPVYLVSHIVTMYMMPELGLIIALERSRGSRFQKIKILPVTTAVHVTMWCLPIRMTFKDTSSIVASLMCSRKIKI